MYHYSVFSGFRFYFDSCKEKKSTFLSCGTVLTEHRLREPMQHHECKTRNYLILCVIYETT